jgi:glycosyltransferase involved in cell wall biosynthesis
MATAVLELLADRKLLQQYKEQARDRAVTEFDSSIVVPRYLEAYAEALNRPAVALGGV